MDYLIAPGPGDRGSSGPGQRTNGGSGPDPATTINGVVINVNGSNSPALSQVSKDLYTYVTIFEQFSLSLNFAFYTLVFDRLFVYTYLSQTQKLNSHGRTELCSA